MSSDEAKHKHRLAKRNSGWICLKRGFRAYLIVAIVTLGATLGFASGTSSGRMVSIALICGFAFCLLWDAAVILIAVSNVAARFIGQLLSRPGK